MAVEVNKNMEAKGAINLPDNKATFTIDVEGEVTGIRYQGNFECICILSQAAKTAASVMEARMRDNLTQIDDSALLFCRAISQLEFRVIGAPAWWKENDKGRLLPDITPVLRAFNEALKAEENWRQAILKKKEPPAQNVPPEVKTTDEGMTPKV